MNTEYEIEVNHPLVVNHLDEEVRVHVRGLRRFEDVFRVPPTANRALSVDQLPSPAPGVWHVIEHTNMDLKKRTDLVKLQKLYSCNMSRTAFDVFLPGSGGLAMAARRRFEDHQALEAMARAKRDAKRDAKPAPYVYQHRVQVPKVDYAAIERRAVVKFLAIWATGSVAYFAAMSILSSLFG